MHIDLLQLSVIPKPVDPKALTLTCHETNSASFCCSIFTTAMANDTATFVPGAYAVSIDARMPDDIVEQLEENRRRLHTVLATAEKAE